MNEKVKEKFTKKNIKISTSDIFQSCLKGPIGQCILHQEDTVYICL